MASDKRIRFPSSAARQTYEANRRKVIRSADVCAICGEPLDKNLPKYHPLSVEADHIVPVSKGGDPSAAENLQAVHRRCNLAKGAKTAAAKVKRREAGVDPAGWLAW
jgi:5-methylcytosine-specific restriction endonuclease McrA